MILMLACPRDGWLQYASAGHETALLRLPTGETRELTSTGLLLGVLPEADWLEEKIAVHLGSRLLMVTDGVTEMFDSNGKCFGRDRLAEAYAATADSDGPRAKQRCMPWMRKPWKPMFKTPATRSRWVTQRPGASSPPAKPLV